MDMLRGALSADLVLGVLLASTMVVCTALASWRLAFLLVGGRAAHTRWAATYLIGLFLATGGFFALYPLGLFQRYAGALAPVVVLALSFGVRRDLRLGRMWAFERAELARFAAAIRGDLFGKAAVFFFLPFVAVRTAWSSINPVNVWDTLVYHGPRAAIFVQNGGFTFPLGPAAWDNYRGLFAGAEILMAWAILPFGEDTLLAFLGCVQWWGAGLGTWALAEALGLRRSTSVFVALAGMFVPVAAFFAGTGYVENLMNGALLCSFALGVDYLKRAEPVDLALAITGIGLATGVKIVAGMGGALSALLLLSVALLSRRHRRARPYVAALVGVAAAAICVVPYLVHNYLETGYPIYGLNLEVLGMKLGRASAHSEIHTERMATGAYTWPREKRALEEMFLDFGRPVDPQAGPAAAFALLLMPLGAALGLTRRRALPLALALLSAVAQIALQYLPQVASVRMVASAGISRYMYTAVLVALPVALVFEGRFPRLARALSGLLFVGFAWEAIVYSKVAWSAFQHPEIAYTLAKVAVGAAALYLLWRFGPKVRVPVAAALVLWWVAHVEHVAASWRHAPRRAPGYAGVYSWMPGAAALDEPGTEHVLAITSGPSLRPQVWFTYYFYGSRLQNRLTYVPITADGGLVNLVPGTQPYREADQAAWLRRLAEEGITHVVSFAPASRELEWMRTLGPGRFRPVAQGGDWGVFEVVRSAPRAGAAPAAP